MKGASHSQAGAGAQAQPGRRRRWGLLLPLLVGAAFLAEIAFLGRLDMAKNAEAVESWTTSFYRRSANWGEPAGGGGGDEGDDDEIRRCKERLEREDDVPYDRDFDKDPVLVGGAAKDWNKCYVGCEFGFSASKTPDAAFGISPDPSVDSILRSMESSQYYSENNIDVARGRGYKIVMTTSLSSDVPVGYFSWAEYDIMAPVPPKTEEALAAAFISNCGARNFRLQALEMLENLDVKIDSYGSCHRNRDGKVDKVETLKRYKFSLAFENSNEEDYVTEKFFQSLVAGSIPVVVGAPNIQEFSPGEGAILHIKELDDAASVAKTMKHIASNPGAFNQSLRSGQITLGALESAVLAKFRSLNHVPVWKDERPPSIRGGDDLKVYKIYPVGLTQRQALYGFRFRDDSELEQYIKDHPCAKLEVIFV
ncbi:unnamed protein product [Urochloa decumbens]|uniref:Fucosyltransferase n=1 Tax=Urochloa decumbens TaxID=240449 RepID=A0ABC9BCY5_9POAL